MLWKKFSPANETTTNTTPTTQSTVAKILQEQTTWSTITTGNDVAINNLQWLWYAWGWEYKPFFPQSAKEALSAGKQVILYFYADRDPTDKILDNDILKRPDRVPANTIIFRIDYDANKNLRDSFHVTQQNTLIFLNKEGTERTRRAMGITSLAQIVVAMKE